MFTHMFLSFQVISQNNPDFIGIDLKVPQDVLLLEELRRSSSKSVTNGWRTYLASGGCFSHADSLSFKVFLKTPLFIPVCSFSSR